MHRRRFLSAVALAPVVIPVVPGVLDSTETAAEQRRGHEDTKSLVESAAQSARMGAPAPGSIGAALELAGNFRVLRARDVFCGTLSFLLEGEGERFQIDVLRRDVAGPRGVFETERFSLFVHGHGATATAPAHERGARALGSALERRARAGVPVPVLASFLERRARFPRGELDLSGPAAAHA